MRVMMVVCLLSLLCAIGRGEMAMAQQAPAAPTGIEGFRSAKFGQPEAQVRAAIREDFKLNDAAIKASTHPLEQTRSLSITVKDLIANSGNAQIAYVFGFRSKTLIQVNILWNAPDPASTEIIIGAGNALRDYFVSQSTRFVKDKVKTNVQLPDGRILLFQGADEKGRAIELVMVVAARPQVQGQPADPRPGSAQLRLLYVLAPGNSDIRRIQPGQF
ncbi:MAG: hypothetical protein KF889_29055 [Alphaproteobacteria bacterium]|nr:hypothetical protein [Alphaproteobacteria bacterium]MCW5742442.1 hypothetical protein [Alphaproteobacteria bacterium]